MEAICSFETSVDTQRTTRRYIPEDGTLQYLQMFVLVFGIFPSFLNFYVFQKFGLPPAGVIVLGCDVV
jgi:hypothetical protein